MSDVKMHVSSPEIGPSSEWMETVRSFSESGTLSVGDVWEVLGNPVGGVVGSALPDVETTYRNAMGS